MPPVGERRRRLPALGSLVPRRLGPRALVRRQGRARGHASSTPPTVPRWRIRRSSWPAAGSTPWSRSTPWSWHRSPATPRCGPRPTRWSTSSTAGGTPICARGSTPVTATATSGRVRTLDALLPVLVSGRADAVDAASTELLDPAALRRRAAGRPACTGRADVRGPHLLAGPGVAPAHLPGVGRGPATAPGGGHAPSWRRCSCGARSASDWAEYWDPDDGTGLGAAPQSWAALAGGGGRRGRRRDRRLGRPVVDARGR